MGKVVVVNHLTLNGVMQGPGRPDEDTRDRFEHGGWAASRNDEIMRAAVAERMSGEHAFLFGRHGYEDMLAAWNRMGGPHREGLNNTPNYVASRHPRRRSPGRTRRCYVATSPPPWANSSGPRAGTW
jgi:dihydrofolate reductase